MRIIAQAVPVSLCQIFLLEPVQDCTEEQIMQVPVLQIIEICRNHMPVLYVAFRLRRPRSPWRFPTCKLSLVRCSGTSVSTHWTPAAGYTYWAHAQGLVFAENSSSEIVALAQKPTIYQALNRAMGPGAVGSLATPQNCCQVPAERDMCAYGCICVAAVAAPRPLFMTSWCLRATGRRFRPRREECLSLSLSLIGVAALISHCVLASIRLLRVIDVAVVTVEVVLLLRSHRGAYR